MSLHDAFSGSGILASMITPAVLISACGTLIFSTSARMGRIFDRVNIIKTELDHVIGDDSADRQEKLSYLKEQIALQKRRAVLIHRAMTMLYSSTVFFIASSLAIAINDAYGGPATNWVPTLIAMLGGIFLFTASAFLLYESRFNLRFVTRHMEYLEFVHAGAVETQKSGKRTT